MLLRSANKGKTVSTSLGNRLIGLGYKFLRAAEYNHRTITGQETAAGVAISNFLFHQAQGLSSSSVFFSYSVSIISLLCNCTNTFHNQNMLFICHNDQPRVLQELRLHGMRTYSTQNWIFPSTSLPLQSTSVSGVGKLWTKQLSYFLKVKGLVIVKVLMQSVMVWLGFKRPVAPY